MFSITIKRTYTDRQTTGQFIMIVDSVKKVTGVTLELPWLNNQPNKSCIPEGTYELEVYDSVKFGKCLHVKDVPDRDYILIHAGNYVSDTRGCILPGVQFTDLNRDGLMDVTASKATMALIMDNMIGTKGVLVVI